MALTNEEATYAGFVVWSAIAASGPLVCYRIGILLLPEHRGRGLGSAAQCPLADHLFSTTLAHRVEAGTEVDNVPEQRALEKAGFSRESLHPGCGFRQGRIVDGMAYARLRSDPHP